jgi:hypothetical protein
MTNRVLPAQGEERGASFTLIRLDGDAFGKFQGIYRKESSSGSGGRKGINKPAKVPEYAEKSRFVSAFGL